MFKLYNKKALLTKDKNVLLTTIPKTSVGNVSLLLELTSALGVGIIEITYTDTDIPAVVTASIDNLHSVFGVTYEMISISATHFQLRLRFEHAKRFFVGVIESSVDLESTTNVESTNSDISIVGEELTVTYGTPKQFVNPVDISAETVSVRSAAHIANSDTEGFSKFACHNGIGAFGFITSGGEIKVSFDRRVVNPKGSMDLSGTTIGYNDDVKAVKVPIPPLQEGIAKCIELYITDYFGIAWLDNGDLWVWGDTRILIGYAITKPKLMLTAVTDVWFDTSHSTEETTYHASGIHYVRTEDNVYHFGKSHQVISRRGTNGTYHAVLPLPGGYAYDDISFIHTSGWDYGSSWLVMKDGTVWTTGHDAGYVSVPSGAAGFEGRIRQAWLRYQHLQSETIVDIKHNCGRDNDRISYSGGTAAIRTENGSIYMCGKWKYGAEPMLIHSGVTEDQEFFLTGTNAYTALVLYTPGSTTYKVRGVNDWFVAGGDYQDNLRQGNTVTLTAPVPISKFFAPRNTSTKMFYKSVKLPTAIIGTDDCLYPVVRDTLTSAEDTVLSSIVGIQPSGNHIKSTLPSKVTEAIWTGNQLMIAGCSDGTIWTTMYLGDMHATPQSSVHGYEYYNRSSFPTRIY